MDSACCTYVGEERCTHGFSGETLGKGDHSEDPGVDGRIILKWIFGKRFRGMDWIDLAQDRDIWRAVLAAVMNLLVP